MTKAPDYRRTMLACSGVQVLIATVRKIVEKYSLKPEDEVCGLPLECTFLPCWNIYIYKLEPEIAQISLEKIAITQPTLALARQSLQDQDLSLRLTLVSLWVLLLENRALTGGYLDTGEGMKPSDSFESIELMNDILGIDRYRVVKMRV